jgi:hypothetical protein
MFDSAPTDDADIIIDAERSARDDVLAAATSRA